MVELTQREEGGRLIVTGTLTYRVGTVNIKGVDAPAVDWLDGRGWQVIRYPIGVFEFPSQVTSGEK